MHRLDCDRRRLEERAKLRREVVRQSEREAGGFVDHEDVSLGVRPGQVNEVARLYRADARSDLLDASDPFVPDPDRIVRARVTFDEEAQVGVEPLAAK